MDKYLEEMYEEMEPTFSGARLAAKAMLDTVLGVTSDRDEIWKTQVWALLAPALLAAKIAEEDLAKVVQFLAKWRDASFDRVDLILYVQRYNDFPFVEGDIDALYFWQETRRLSLKKLEQPCEWEEYGYKMPLHAAEGVNAMLTAFLLKLGPVGDLSRRAVVCP